MASHIVSWGGNSHIVSPVLSSSTPSIVSVNSLLPNKPETSSVVQEAPCTAESRVKRTSSLIEPSRADGAGRGDDSLTGIRHPTYFFKDGNVTFLVDSTLYCVHRYFFSRDSVYFSTLFDQLGFCDHEALPITISLGDISRKDFDAFLSILYPKNFEQHDLSYEEWKSVLHLSICWDITSIRRLALNNIQPPTPHDRLLLARTYSVNDWVIPALSELCERSVTLSLDEARQMNIEDAVLVATAREEVRNHALQVDATEILGCVEAAQAGKLVGVDGFDVPSAVVELLQASLPVIQKRISKEHVTDESDDEVLVRPITAQYDKGSFQKESEATRTTGVLTGTGTAHLEGSHAEVTAKCEINLEDGRRMTKVTKHKAEAEREAEDARVAKLEAEAEEAKCKAEVAEREAETLSLPAPALLWPERDWQKRQRKKRSGRKFGKDSSKNG